MVSFNSRPIPTQGQKIEYCNGRLIVPDRPIIPFIEGDGIGRDIWKAAVRIFDAAVEQIYGIQRRVIWYEVFAGEKAYKQFQEWLPTDTLEAISEFRIAIKGPLTTPIGGGFRSLNVALRQELELYACWRPVRWFTGVPSPVKHPERMNVVIFRENTEDVYAGIEWKQGTPEAIRIIEFLSREMDEKKVRFDSGIGIKPISMTGSKRLIRRAIQYALAEGRRSVTLVHKGNIMKFTEGAFRNWGYELAREEFGDVTVTEDELMQKYGGSVPPGRLLIKDRLADNMFQQILLRPEEYDVLATPNLNGDYLSDASAAQVGGLGLAPGANIGNGYGCFEATHGTAPQFADRDVANPSALILSGAMMFHYMGWRPVANLIEESIACTIEQGLVTYDLECQMEGSTKLRTSEFASAVIENMAATLVTAN